MHATHAACVCRAGRRTCRTGRRLRGVGRDHADGVPTLATSPGRAAGSAGSPPSTPQAHRPRTLWFTVKEAETAGTAVKRLDDKGQESGRHLSRVGLTHLDEDRCHRGSPVASGQLRDLRAAPRLRTRDRRCAGRGTIAVGGSRSRPQPLVGGVRARGLPRSPWLESSRRAPSGIGVAGVCPRAGGRGWSRVVGDAAPAGRRYELVAARGRPRGAEVTGSDCPVPEGRQRQG